MKDYVEDIWKEDLQIGHLMSIVFPKAGLVPYFDLGIAFQLTPYGSIGSS